MGLSIQTPLLIWATCCNQSNEGKFSVLSSTIYEIKLSLHNGHHDLTLIKCCWHKNHQYLSFGVLSLSLSFLCFSLLRPLPSLLCSCWCFSTPTRLAAMPTSLLMVCASHAEFFGAQPPCLRQPPATLAMLAFWDHKSFLSLRASGVCPKTWTKGIPDPIPLRSLFLFWGLGSRSLAPR